MFQTENIFDKLDVLRLYTLNIFPLSLNWICYSEKVSTRHNAHIDFISHICNYILMTNEDDLICINNYI